MRREREWRFELLDDEAGWPSQSGWTALSSLAMVAALAWAAWAWKAERDAKADLERASAALAGAVRSVPAVLAAPSLPPEVTLAASAIAAPIGTWLRELEGCLPDDARVLSLRIDTLARQARVEASLAEGSRAEAWVACLNGASSPDLWILESMRRASTATGESSGTVSITVSRKVR